MKVVVWVAVLLCASPCVAQDKPAPTAKLATPTRVQLTQCQADLKKASLDYSTLADDTAGRAEVLTQHNAELEKQNANLTEQLEHATTLLKVLHKELTFATLSDDDKKSIATIPRGAEVLSLAVAIEKDQNEYIKVVQKLVEGNTAMVQKYNSLLSVAQSQQAQLEAANSRQQRVNNTLAFYSLMPKYQPPQTINLQVTNCTALPALCVH